MSARRKAARERRIAAATMALQQYCGKTYAVTKPPICGPDGTGCAAHRAAWRATARRKAACERRLAAATMALQQYCGKTYAVTKPPICGPDGTGCAAHRAAWRATARGMGIFSRRRARRMAGK